MKRLLIISSILYGCGSECISTDKYQCTPKEEEEQAQVEEVGVEEIRSTQEKCFLDSKKLSGCLWAPVSLGGSEIKLGFNRFDDIDHFAREHLNVLSEMEVELDTDGDGNDLTFKFPREVTNLTFADNINYSLSGTSIHFNKRPFGGELRSDYIFVQEKDFNIYTLRLYRKLDMVEKNTDNQVIRESCLEVEWKNDIEIQVDRPTYLPRIQEFDLKFYEGKCSK